ncbi:hypothetical protein BWQ96_01473 [Gracilariopsis chorda]|uniref:Uncharacterized protein n=1 Tax=Gracilariopsis chorda TaxID=448386 RepID=A0A2V3J2F1_9FLOR|nr:hypothetical protein BWQ96_01473 [Gracilariopsis chorda]|eukprot:PXF48621.1 hypothetical protein BWQ96_01473 [Gracilariopsis chorda]
MSRQYEEAPPLPREPTALNVPAVMRPSPAPEQQSTQPQPVSPETLPEAAPSLPELASSTDVPLASTQPPPAQPPAEEALFELQLSPDDIRATIERDSVKPGTGAMKAVEVGHRIWTDHDQQELDRLLREGQSVYVPPDVETHDLLSSRSGDYVYVPVPAEGVAEATDQLAVSERITAWNQVVSQEQHPSQMPFAAGLGTGLATGAGAASFSSTGPEHTQHSSSVTDDRVLSAQTVQTSTTTQPEGVVEPTREGETLVDEYGKPTVVGAAPIVQVQPDSQQKTAAAEQDTGATTTDRTATADGVKPKAFDASKSIFGGTFITVRVTSYSAAEKGAPDTMESQAEQQGAATHVKLRDNATAEIRILKDYGLKGGHKGKVNDAAFTDDNTLITCGHDGKVCIWDVQGKHVEREFIPYEGQPVTMVYPIPDDDRTQPMTLMTFSKSRVMRIWTVDAKQAVLLRSTEIQESDKDLYMSIPFISKELKARAAAAVAAAAVTTTDTPQADAAQSAPDAPPAPSPPEGAEPDEDKQAAEASATGGDAAVDTTEEGKEEEKDKKRFSFTKVLSFGRSSRKAVAS